MAGRSAWTPGNATGSLTTWTTLINSSEMASMTAGYSVLSAVVIANQTNLDQFMSISAQLTAAGTTPAIAAGSTLAIWLAAQQQDGSTYGDGILTAGTPANLTPAWAPIAVIPLYASSRNALVGSVDGLIIPPRPFSMIIQPNIAAATGLSSATQNLKYITYNQNLNN